MSFFFNRCIVGNLNVCGGRELPVCQEGVQE